MVEITNGKKRFRVPAGAVEVYKGMGFRVVGDVEPNLKTSVNPSGNDAGEEDEDVTDIPGFGDDEADGDDAGEDADGGDGEDTDGAADEKYAKELLEKPISQWTPEEIKEFARIKGIDTSAAKKVSEARTIVKKFLEEQNKGE